MQRALVCIKILLILNFALFWSNALAQNAPPKKESGLTIIGKIVDQQTNTPIEYATVALYVKANNKLLTGIVTDSKGNFSLPEIKVSDIYIVVTFMGYKTLKIETIPNPIEQIINLKTIKLASTTEELNEVEVVARSSQFEYQLDKKVIDVASQTTAASATAIEVLESAPSVKVDVEGNVTLRGNSGFTVLIDGKPTALESSDALRSLPASSIQKIEIITNPSAKYQPDGTAGIINVIMKKNRSNGFNGVVNLNKGVNGTYGGDILLNLRVKKINYNIGADYNKRTFINEIEGERIVKDRDTIYATTEGDQESSHIMSSIKGGIDYDLSKNNTLSLGFRVGSRNMENNSVQNYIEKYSNTEKSVYYHTYNESNRKGRFGGANLSFTHNFSKPQHTLSLQGDYNKMSGKNENISEQNDTLYIPTEGKKNRTTTERTQGQIRIDYVNPITNISKLEAGYQGRLEFMNQVTFSDTLNLLSNIYQGDPKYSDDSNYDQNIQAVYSTFSTQWNKFGYQLGLRGEYTLRTINTTSSPQEYIIDKWDLFPTIHLSYKLPADHQLALSYSRRIERTRGWDLNPFIVWVDPYNVRQGNPSLDNQYIDAFEIGYNKQFKPVDVSLEAFYTITNNKIEYLKTVYEENVVMQSPYNIGNDYNLGLEGNITTKPFKIWELNLLGSLSDYRLKSTMDGYSVEKSSFNWNGKVRNTFTITKNQQLQLIANYNSRTVTTQGYNSANYAIDGAYRIDFMQKKISLIAQARDIFLTDIRESYSETPTIYSHSSQVKKTPIITLTVTYRINNYKQKRSPANGSAEMGEE